jgi:hypothetical protein
MNKAKFKFNGGAAALLCSKCNVIMKTGKDFTQEEWKAMRGELKLESQFCNLCKAKLRDEKIDSVIN